MEIERAFWLIERAFNYLDLRFLVGAGVSTEQVVTSSRGKLDAVGTDEGSWVKDRRVDIEVR